MFYATTLALLLVFLTTIFWYLKRKYSATYNRSHKIPGPKPEWFFGNLRNTGIIAGEKATYQIFAELKEKYGDVFTFWRGSTYSVVLSRVEHVRHVLADKETYDQSDTTINTASLLFPAGLIALRGNDWKRHARFLLPMFRRAKITPYLDTIVDCVDRFINERFVHQNGKIHTDLVAQCQGLLLNIMARIAFDYDPKQSSTTDHDIQQAFNDYLHYGTQLLLAAVLPHWIGKLLLLMHWKFQRARRIVKQYVMKIITEEQNRQQQQKSASNKPKSLVASLVAAIKEESSSEASLTPNDVFDEVSMANVAGFEATASVVCWFIFYMSKYSNIQQKLKDEFKENNLTPDVPLTQEILDSLVYVECFTKEVLRFAPIDAAIARQATRDDMIDDIPVKKDDIILISIQNLHRDPRYWNIDPSKFVPERWLDEDKSPPRGAYMPFGGGHRACAGPDLALFELKVTLVRLIQRVSFEDPGEEANNSGGFIERINCFPKYMAVRVHMDSNKTTG